MQNICDLTGIMEQRFGAGHKFESSSNKSELLDARRRQALEIEQAVLNERNAAYERMVFHERSCPVCNRKHKRKPHRTECAVVTEDSLR